MKTQIKTKDLQKLIDPVTDGITYKGEKVVLDLSVLKEYVTFPRKKEVFTPSLNTQENLYKNAALYIINSSEQAFISLDLNKQNPIESGLFEYVKTIYKKETDITVSIPEEGDNLLFIESKKLKAIEKSKMNKAQDIEYAELSSVFMQTKKMTEDDVKIVEKNKFFWQEDGADLYSNKNWALSQIQEVLKGNKYAKDSPLKTNLLTLISKLNSDLKESEDFKVELLNLNDSFLNKFLLIHNPSLIKFDFNSTPFQDKVMQDVKSSNFGLLEILVEKSIKSKTSNPELRKFINQEEAVKYLAGQHLYNGSYPSDNTEKFTVVSCYPYFNDENQRKPEIVDKYISCCMGKNMSDEPYVSDTMIYKLPPDIFDNAPSLSKVLKYLNLKDFSKYLKDNYHTNNLLSDKQFLLDNASNLSPYKIENIMDLFFKKEDIDKKFILKLIENKPSIFTEIANDTDSLFRDKVKDLDVIMLAHESGVKIKEISHRIMEPHFLSTGTKEEEKFKLEYIINHKMLYDSRVTIYDSPEENKVFKDKYYKLEYMFLTADDRLYENKEAGKSLSKIKDVEVFKELMDKINNLQGSFELDCRKFYANMHPELKANLKLLEDTDLLYALRFSDLPETLQYNKKVAIEFVGKDTNLIPKEFFNDINFSLEFAKCLDNGVVSIEKAPVFISKFFENQSVSSKYHDYLKTYIAMSGINQALEQKEESTTPRKMKI
jgi:hypothetical protein